MGDPYQICLTLIKEAIKRGVKVYENCKVTQISCIDNKVDKVVTAKGAIDCKYFVNCTGFWARSVGKLSEPFVKVNHCTIVY